MGTINPVGFSLSTSEATTSTPQGVKPARAISPAEQDLAEIASVPAISQVAPLQTDNPARLQVVLSDAVRQLKEALLQTTDPVETAYLSGLASRFQQLQEFSSQDGSSAAASVGS